MLISPAYAQSAGGLGGIPPDILLLVAIGAIFYFLLLRPQQKQRKAHREMLENLRRGDQVVTGGGIIGKVTKVNNETELTVEIAEDIRVTIARGTIAAVVDKQDGPRAQTGGDRGGGGGGKKTEETEAKQRPASPLGGLLGTLLGGRK
ncbi:MAG: preprotein translocase subunit YajC [Alphaproteobacteria bacterium]|nr:preprotein translocase subunit YajC [Alphaproteobacteria bacterium]